MPTSQLWLRFSKILWWVTYLCAEEPNTMLYPLKACVMLNTFDSASELFKTSFVTGKDALISLALLLIAAGLFAFLLVFDKDLQAAYGCTPYGSVLTVFLLVALLDQLGVFYFKQRWRWLLKTISYDEYGEYIG